MSLDDYTEYAMEIDGKTYLVWKRTRLVLEEQKITPIGHPCIVEDGGVKEVTEYSMDHAETWHPTMLLAYTAASASFKLMIVTEAEGEGGEFEAFMLSLMLELKKMSVGEELEIMRTDGAFVVTKRQGVLSVRASTLTDIDLEITDEVEEK